MVIHAVCYKWDTIEFLIPMSHFSPLDFYNNVPLLSHLPYMGFYQQVHALMTSHLACPIINIMRVVKVQAIPMTIAELIGLAQTKNVRT